MLRSGMPHLPRLQEFHRLSKRRHRVLSRRSGGLKTQNPGPSLASLLRSIFSPLFRVTNSLDPGLDEYVVPPDDPLASLTVVAASFIARSNARGGIARSAQFVAEHGLREPADDGRSDRSVVSRKSLKLGRPNDFVPQRRPQRDS
jgi:hypothetical protein